MSRRNTKNLIMWIVLAVTVVFFTALFIYNAANPQSNAHIGDNKPWVKNMSKGKEGAPSTFVQYTDYFCSFCAEVHDAVKDPNFQKDYIDSGKIRYENRVITVLKDLSPNTVQGAEAATCAADQDKYWQYSDDIIPRIKADYFDKGIGVKNVANPVPIEKLPLEYFITSAKAVGLDVDKFSTCMKDAPHANEIAQNTNRALETGVSGLPYLVVNDYQTSGFMGGYKGLQTVLKAGGVEAN